MVSAVIVAVIVLPVQVMEPSGPLFRVHSDGQPVVPAALGKVILVEFANVAFFVSLCLWHMMFSRDLLEYGTVVATLKGMVRKKLQARAKRKKSDLIAKSVSQ